VPITLIPSSRRPIGNWLRAAVALSLVISFTPWAQFLLYPFKLFTTWVHECGHALMTILVGGRVMSITEPDTRGLTQSLGPVGRVARGLVASSGYLNAAIVGCLLMAATRVERWAHVIPLSLGACGLHARPLDAQSIWRCGRARVGCDARRARTKGRWTCSAILPEPAGRSGGPQLGI
jgi:hypothetical protein